MLKNSTRKFNKDLTVSNINTKCFIIIELNTDLKIIWLDHQNNYTGNLNIMSNAAKSFDILTIGLNVLHNYFDSPIKLFSNLYVVV